MPSDEEEEEEEEEEGQQEESGVFVPPSIFEASSQCGSRDI